MMDEAIETGSDRNYGATPPPGENGLAPGFVMERTTLANIGEIRPLFERLFGRAPAPGILRLKYTTPFHPGSVFLGHLVRNAEGLVVGHYGAILQKFRAARRVVLVGQGCEVMALPGRRHAGMFQALGRATDQALANAGAECCIGFANEASRAALVKRLGWTAPYALRGFRIPVSTVPIAAMARRVGLERAWLAWACRRLESLRAPDQILPGSARDDEGGGALRDADHYAYRRFSVNTVIEIRGVRAWVKVDRSLVIGEIERVDESRVLDLLNGLRRVARGLGLTEILFHASPRAWSTEILEKHFPGFESWTLVYKVYQASSIDPARLRLTAGDVDTF